MSEVFSHNAATGQFEARIEGRLAGVAHYALDKGVAVFDHTAVPAAFEGRGVAGRLVRHAMDHARSNRWKVRPVCPYVRSWFERNPDYADLLD